MSLATNRNEIIEDIKKNHNKVKVAITDLDGILRGKYIHKEKFLKAIENGFGFCTVVFGWDSSDICYDNVAYTGWHTGYPDGLVNLDLSTFRKIPWEQNIPFVLGEFLTENNQPLALCPRQLLKKVLSDANDLGWEPKVGLEFEWFNFKETPEALKDKAFREPTPLTPGMFGYSLLRSSYNQNFFHQLMDQLLAFNVPLEGLHTETGPGVFEAAILYSDGLEAADRAALFKNGVKEIAYQNDAVATFMARWNNQLPGCSGHIHQSLVSTANGKNAFFDEKASNAMSSTFESYVAGQIKLLPELLPMLAPNVNSYKRLVEGFWAPTRATWGIDNRTTAFRVIPGSAQSTRLETRVGGADLNPYLAVAATVGAGVYGIKNGLRLDQPPVSGNAYEDRNAPAFPKTLIEATQRFSESRVAKELFGEVFVDHYARTREWEWRQSQQAVTDWELKRYFEII